MTICHQLFFQQIPVPFFLHVFFGYKAEGGAVDAVADAFWAFVWADKDVTQVAVSRTAADFDALHAVGIVLVGGQNHRLQRCGECGPAAAALEFIFGGEQRLSRHHVHVNAFGVVIPVGVPESRLGAIFLGNMVGVLWEFCPDGCIVRARIAGRIYL